ncbi:37S ribosomal protein MRP4 mitochondrial [Spathaspora sp. JA1]|nr:37S ribosomal protein MRP4 mitochondrial [Spathaspora sp. JA1]
MIRQVRSCIRVPKSSKLCFKARRSYSDAEPSEVLSQKELRNKEIQEALAKEEEAFQRSKEMKELKHKTVEMISSLNRTPASLINARLQKLQQDLDNLPAEKVKQLDEELQEFMNSQVDLPTIDSINRPWVAKISTEDHSQRLIPTESKFGAYPNLRTTPDYKGYSEQELYLRQLHYARICGKAGSKLTNIYRPEQDIKYPPSVNDTTIANLMAAGCHFGHSKQSWRESTQPFIYGEYNGIHLIDLNVTVERLKHACNVVKGVAEKGGVIVYVGTHKNTAVQNALIAAAKKTKGFYVSKRWIPGIISNYIEVTRQIKKEIMVEVDMEDNLTGNSDLRFRGKVLKPDLVVLLNPLDNRNCVNECAASNIPTVGLCDTNMEPSLLTYPIPCNDDSIRAVTLMLGILSRAAQDGVNARLDAIKEHKEIKAKIAKAIQSSQGQAIE